MQHDVARRVEVVEPRAARPGVVLAADFPAFLQPQGTVNVLKEIERLKTLFMIG